MKSIKDLRGKNIVVYDCEIKSEIGKNDVTWNTHEKMGISVAALYDYEDGDTKIYLDDNIEELGKRLARAQLVVGYNIVQFDNPLVRATIKNNITIKSYDMLIEVRKSTRQFFPKGCRLNDVLAATFDMQKTEDGAEAPLMYQRGEIGRVITYCLADVRRERMAFEYAYIHGHLKTKMHGTHEMRDPIAIYNGT